MVLNCTNNLKKTVILFIPEIGIYPYARGLAVLGDAVVKQGGRVFVTHDTGQMFRSPFMAMHRLPVDASQKEKNKLIRKNNKVFKQVLQKYNFSSIELSDLVDKALINEINTLVNTDDLESITYRGFPVGKISQYDFILETKFPFSNNISEEQKELFRLYIKNTALSVAITDRICEKYNPTLFLTFNEYAQCQAVRYGAYSNHVSRMALTYPTHFNVDASRFLVWESTCEYWRYTHCQNWNNVRNFSINKEAVEECWKDAVFRMYSTGSHIFSSQKKNDLENIFRNLKLDTNKKTVVVYTSSQDERRSVEIAMNFWKEDNNVQDAFLNQIDWLKMLRDYANERNDIQILVRIHPREGHRGGGFHSDHLKQLYEVFRKNTKNFTIIWPDDPVSSYDLIELADVCLVAWSLMGQEAARLGIPVLSFTGNMFYPNDDFIQVATSQEEYRIKLDSVLKMEYKWQHLLKAVRFYHWRTFIPSLNLGETVPVDFQDDTIWPEAPESKVGVINDILNGKQDLIEYNITQWQNSLPIDALERETEAMRQGIRYFLDNIFYPPSLNKNKSARSIVFLIRIYNIIYRIYYAYFANNRKLKINNEKNFFVDYHLEFSSDISKLEIFRLRTSQDKNLRIIVEDGLLSILVNKGKIIRRMLPTVNRLARLYVSSNVLLHNSSTKIM